MVVPDTDHVHATVVRLHIEGIPLDWEYVFWYEEAKDADPAVPRA